MRKFTKMNSITKDELDDLAVENFRAYLRIPSVQPDVNYDGCVAFIKSKADEIGLPLTVYEFTKGKPILLLKWEGKNPKLPAILFNSHMDVVPVLPELWHYDPFGAEMDANGNIYARGAQDCKCIGIQYLEAIRRLILKRQKNKRTVYVSFVPDEEVGGIDGMKLFVTKQEFKNLNIGFAFDEGGPSPVDIFAIFYAERAIWQMEVTIPGTEGHGSALVEDTAGEKLRRFLDKLMDYRQSQLDIQNQNPNPLDPKATSVNLTILTGGVQVNVLPSKFVASIDMRIAFDVDLDEFEKQIRKWCDESGEGIEINFLVKDPAVEATKLDDKNPYWVAVKNKMKEMGETIITGVLYGNSDSRFLRGARTQSINFSPMNNTPSRVHGNDEYLNKDVFLRGIQIYEGIMTSVAKRLNHY